MFRTTRCNLASLNLMKFVQADGEFDVDAFRFAAKVTITAQEILVDNASYPTPKIEENTPPFPAARHGLRQPRRAADEPRPRVRLRRGPRLRGAITALMTGEAYRQSVDHRPRPRRPVLRLRINESRSCASSASTATRPTHPDGRRPGRRCWTAPGDLGRGPRAGHASTATATPRSRVLAPTGTIAFMMDCDTTGIEPDIALIKYKKLVGEGFLKIVNQTVPGGPAQARLHPRPGRGDRRLHQRARDDRGRARPASPSTCRSSTAPSSRSTASGPSTTWATSG